MKLKTPYLLSLMLFPLLVCGGIGKSLVVDEIDVGMRPESVVRGFDDDLYVTVMNGHVRGDGVIKRVRNGRVTIHTTGLDEPKGIAFVGKYLVCSDVFKVWKIDAFGRKTVLANQSDFPFPVRYLNDVVAAPEGDAVYVTDMGDRDDMWQEPGVFWPLDSDKAAATERVGRVYRIEMNGKISVVIEPSDLMICPNGVGIGKDGQLLIGGFFTGNLLQFKDGELTVIKDGFRGADAVEQDSKGNYYVSSWNQGTVWKITAEGDVKTLVDGLASAADFLLEEDTGLIYLPDMKAGTLITLKTN